MKSLYPGKCACCDERFPKGAEIDFIKGDGAYLPGHVKGKKQRTHEQDVELAERLGFRKQWRRRDASVENADEQGSTITSA